MNISPRLFRFLFNFYGPYVGTASRITHVSQNWQELRVTMKLRWYNRNSAGTQFGGGMFAMVDPHPVLQLGQLLGQPYVIWDKSAHIEFIKPGRGDVHAVIRVSDEDLQQIKDGTRSGGKYFPEFEVPIVNDEGETIALVRKVLYVRKFQPAESPGL